VDVKTTQPDCSSVTLHATKRHVHAHTHIHTHIKLILVQ